MFLSLKRTVCKITHNMRYVGIDVSKLTLDAAVFSEGKDIREFAHTKVENSKNGYRQLLRWLKGQGISTKHVTFGMEHTGYYCHGIQGFLERKNIPYVMLETTLLKNLPFVPKDKNDKLDSQKIADFIARYSDRLHYYHQPSETLARLKEMVRVRKELVNGRTRLENEIKVTDEKDLHRMLSKQIDSFTEDIISIEKSMEDLVESDESLMTNYVLLKTVPSIGIVNAMNTIAITNNFTLFINGRQYARRVGVAPKECDSGKTVHHRARPSLHADLSAKADLSRAAENAIVNSEEFKAYYERKMNGKTRKDDPDTHRKTINAVMFKLILRMFAVIRRQKPYEEMA